MFYGKNDCIRVRAHLGGVKELETRPGVRVGRFTSDSEALLTITRSKCSDRIIIMCYKRLISKWPG